MRRVAATLLLCLMSVGASAETVALECGRVFDSVNARVLGPHVIVIEDERIAAVERGADYGGNGAVVDLSDATCLPGLMDMHTHITSQFSRTTYLDRFRDGPGEIAFKAVPYAERTLMAGFTTIRDLGDRDNLSVAMREAIQRGDLVGPRIVTSAKSIATTGGHADPTNGARFDIYPHPGPEDGVVNGIAEARQGVRQRYKDGADLIKITATGGVLSPAKNGQNPQFREDELRAIVETAADYDMPVAAHAHGAEGMKRAIRAGVISIEHGTLMDDEVIRLMKEHGTYFVPTLMAGEWVAEQAREPGFFPEVVRPKAATLGPMMTETFARAYKAGVKIAFGTDSGVSAHGDNAREFILMVDAGMPAAEALQSATATAAELLGMADRLGSLERGKLADIVAVPGNPVDDIALMEQVVFVMREGAIYRSPER